MKRKWEHAWQLFAACFLAAALLFIPATSLADAGGFAGDSDYGGGGWSSGSDWDSSGWDSDYGSGGIVIGGGSGSLTWAIILIVVLILVFRVKSAGKGRSGSSRRPVHPGAARTRLPMTVAELKQRDPNFSEEAMKEKIGNLYIRMQACWQNKEWEEMRASTVSRMTKSEAKRS